MPAVGLMGHGVVAACGPLGYLVGLFLKFDEEVGRAREPKKADEAGALRADRLF